MRCKECHAVAIYSDRWDSLVCVECEIWLEEACNCDPEDCDFADRPARPEIFYQGNYKYINQEIR